VPLGPPGSPGAGLDDWWGRRLAEARAAVQPPRLTRYEPGTYGPLEVYDVEFSGAHGDRARGWYLRPPGSGGQRVPVVVKFIGYGGGRGTPTEHTMLLSTGLMDGICPPSTVFALSPG
jgi:cephalosporin-C deacetylase